MSPGRALSLLGALALLASLPACPTPCVSGDLGGRANLQELVLVGVPAKLALHAVLSECESDKTLPSSLAVELSGPDNLPVEVQSTFNPASPTVGFLQFTPMQTGRYHLFAAFDPVGGLLQTDIHAAQNRSTETAPQTLPFGCDSLERTLHGAWACDSSVMRDGTALLQFPEGRLAVAGNVVWMMDPRQIQRYVDTGTDLELTGTWPHTEGAVESLLATAEELVTLHAQTVQRITFDGTGLTSGGTTRWAPTTGPGPLPPGLGGPKGLLMRAGDTLGITLSPLLSSSSFSNEACPYTLVKGRFERTASACSAFNGNVVGFEPGGLWVEEFLSSRVLTFHEWTGAGLVPRATLSLSEVQTTSLLPTGQPTVLPVLTSNQSFPADTSRTLRPPHVLMPVYDPLQRRILLEYLDSGLIDARASTTLMWGRSLTITPGGTPTGLRVLSRPPALSSHGVPNP
ncbi:hypothetical protein [Stigmatella aurantiaca]|uniref:Lipoprotein n=1 Tax=Stigmatella aurantiaca (strain DW4/3-1) TaxID=378806 RepID=Q09A05_STIAD|nr:hypothetical protein [Stigmatella aurantiaca]ADO68936.1 uncharacterized protein STAUR_1132 [Stigmatella aurantiaca DW4/3-1]EAU68574.1 hypothetical protein STIAU_8769 [Stigmatella aurantiaca DW4/3-1]